MLFDKVLSQTFSTDIWQATTAISEDYSAEVIFLFSSFGMPSNRIDTDNLTLCGHNNLCGEKSLKCVSLTKMTLNGLEQSVMAYKPHAELSCHELCLVIRLVDRLYYKDFLFSE